MMNNNIAIPRETKTNHIKTNDDINIKMNMKNKEGGRCIYIYIYLFIYRD